MAKPNSEDGADIKVRDGKLVVAIPVTKAEQKHLEEALETGELAHRAAARYLVSRGLMRGQKQPEATPSQAAEGSTVIDVEPMRASARRKKG